MRTHQLHNNHVNHLNVNLPSEDMSVDKTIIYRFKTISNIFILIIRL